MSERSREVICWTVLALFATGCMLFCVEERWRPEWDSALYVLTARSLASGEGYTYLDQPFFLRPPGFSFLLSLVVGIDGPVPFGKMNIMVMVAAMLSLAGCYYAMRPRHGPWGALAVTLLVGTCPLYVVRFNWLQSEFFFLAPFLFGVGLLNRTPEKGKRFWLMTVAGALLIAVSYYARSVTLLVLPGLVIYSWRRAPKASWLRGMVAAGLLLVAAFPWLLHTRQVSAESVRPAEQLLLFDYSTALFHVDPGDPDSSLVPYSQWKKRLHQNGHNLLESLSAAVFHVRSHGAGWLVAILAVAGFVLRCRSGPDVLDWFAPLVLILILGYFQFDDRLVLPLVPMLFSYLATAAQTGARHATRRVRRQWAAPALSGAILLALLGGQLAVMPASLEPGRSPVWNKIEYERIWEDIDSAAQWVRGNTAPDARILCNQAPVLTLLTGRQAYTYLFLRDLGFLERYDVDYVICDSLPQQIEGYIRARSDAELTLPGHTSLGDLRVYRLRARSPSSYP